MLQELIKQHTGLTSELAQQLRELGDMRAAIARLAHSVFANAGDYPITERRERVKYACTDQQAEIEVQLGEIDALRAEINNVEWQIRVLTHDG